MKRSLAVPALLLLLALAACNLPIPQSPTAIPIHTNPSPTAALPTDEPTIAPALTPVAPSIALEAILIGSPGHGSSITSPVTVSGQSRPTFEQNLVIGVYDELGNQLAFQPTTIGAEMGNPGPFSADVAFSVGHEQPGRIAVMEFSAMDGGLLHLASVEVTLLPGGSAVLLSQPLSGENIDIQFPLPNSIISGGSLTVTGFSEYYFESTLGLMLCGGGTGSGAAHLICGESSNVLSSTFAMIASPDIGLPGPFSGELTWSVSAETHARIVVYAESARDGGIVHLSSIPVLLQP